MHKGLQMFIFVQTVFITICCLSVLNVENSKSTTLPWVQAFYNPHTRVLFPILSVSSYALSCMLLYCAFPTAHLFLLRLGMFFCTCSLTLLCCFCASSIVCDPIIRLARDSSLDRIVVLTPDGHSSFGIVPADMSNKPDLLLAPLSTLPHMGPGWVAENRPDFHECSSTTLYSYQGRLLVAVALVNVNSAFVIASAVAHLYKGTFHATVQAIVLYCFTFVLLVNGVSAVAINEKMWDWRMLGLGFFSAFVSSYLAVSVTHTPLPPAPSADARLIPKPPTTIVRAAWLTIQPILALQSFWEKLEEDDDPIASPEVPPLHV
jgi:hypothetical protein